MDFVAYSLAKKYIDNIVSNLPKGINYKGAVDYVNQLPSSPALGDAYTVMYQGTNGTDPDGREFVWGNYNGTNTWVDFGPDVAQYQKLLVSGTNIKTIHGNSLLGAGNIEIPTYSPFKSTWRHDTIAHLIEDINSDNNVVVGSSYLGEIATVTTTEGLFNGNAEMVVNVMRSHLYWCIISSNNVDPYHWEATFSGAAISPKGWTPFVPGDRTIAGINLKDNITKATLQTALEDSTHRFITDSERTSWNSAATFASTPLSIADIFPLDANAADGTYTLKAYKVNGEVAYAWNSDTITVTTYLVTKGTVQYDSTASQMHNLFIKVDETPTSNEDYTYSCTGGVNDGNDDIPAQFTASKLYIWTSGWGSIDAPVNIDLSTYTSYDNAYELTLSADIILSLTYGADS